MQDCESVWIAGMCVCVCVPVQECESECMYGIYVNLRQFFGACCYWNLHTIWSQHGSTCFHHFGGQHDLLAHCPSCQINYAIIFFIRHRPFESPSTCLCLSIEHQSALQIKNRLLWLFLGLQKIPVSLPKRQNVAFHCSCKKLRTWGGFPMEFRWMVTVVSGRVYGVRYVDHHSAEPRHYTDQALWTREKKHSIQKKSTKYRDHK